VQGAAVGFGDAGLLRELVVDVALGRVQLAAIQPRQQSQCKEVLAHVHFFHRHAQILKHRAGHGGHGHLEHLVLIFQHLAVERVLLVLRPFQPLFLEAVRVGDQDPAFAQVGQVGLEGRGVHHHQGVELVARRRDVAGGEMHLKARHTEQRVARSANLGRKVGERGDVVPQQRAALGKLRTGQLHAVARVSREADRGVADRDDFLVLDGSRFDGR
jgi:hypothetical protein